MDREDGSLLYLRWGIIIKFLILMMFFWLSNTGYDTPTIYVIHM
jgi:hypothetical protein